MTSEPSFNTLMAQLRIGDEDAAVKVFRRFAGRLIGLARTRLDRLVRQKVDPEDVLQSVFKSFFLRNQEGQWDLSGWDSLWSLLALMTIRKCGRRAVHYRGGRREIGREAPLVNGEDSSSSALQVLDREPSPEEAAMLAETVESIMKDLEEYHRDIFRLSLQGCSPAEIAAEVSVTERTVQRVLKRVRERLEKQVVGSEVS